MSRIEGNFVFLGLSITSSWGNGHATTYRALLRELSRRGHRVVFLERDLPFYRNNRDLPAPPFGTTEIYQSLDELRGRFSSTLREADLVIVGSYVPEGRRVIELVLQTARGKTAFYDIDTPVTIGQLDTNACEYIDARQIPRLDLYFSFTGGPTLHVLESRYGAKRARALLCSADPSAYYPENVDPTWDLGYLGTYSADRQPKLNELLIQPAQKLPELAFAVAGPQYPADIVWPANVDRTEHLAPAHHRAFYNAQRFTLNVTRQDMVRAGYSPSVRLFEAALCGTPIISDLWAGLETFLEPGREIFLARTAKEVASYLRDVPEERRIAVGEKARQRVLAEHTAEHRAESFERHVDELFANGRRHRPGGPRVSPTTT